MPRNPFEKLFALLVIAIVAMGFFAPTVFASGNIDSVQKYSQFLNLDLDQSGQNDFINWDPTNGGATVTDTALSGYIWGETVGWINLNPTEAGVTNSCSGTLGGYAWGQNTGWINFAPTNATGANQPLINTTTGQITGTVWAQNYGWIQLSSLQTPTGDPYVAYSSSNPDSGLITTWRPSGGCGSSPINGMCGTSNGGSFSSVPSSNLCAAGTSITPVSTGSGWIWECTGTGGGTTASCSATAPTSSGGGGGSGGSGGGGGSTTSGGCALPYTIFNGVCQLPNTSSGGSSGGSSGSSTSGSSSSTSSGSSSTSGSSSSPSSHASGGGSSSSNGSVSGGLPTILSGVSTGTPVPPFVPLPIVVASSPQKTIHAPSPISPILPIVAAIGILSMIPGIITRFANILLALLFGRKRARGVVYDSQNKEPLDPVYVSVIDLVTSREVANQITDIHGRYGFILKPGTYKMTTGKTHYMFPSQKLFGKTSDDVYDNLYFGSAFTINDPNELITMNIPMDPLAVDWNQKEKERTSIVHTFLHTPSWLATLFDILFVIGFVISLVVTYYNPVWWNILMTALYIIIAGIQMIGYGPVHVGIVKKNGSALSFAIVRAYSAALNREIAHTVTSLTGGYYLLVPKGDYYVTFEIKNPDGTYSNIATTQIIRAHSGVISRSFEL